jgi:hypothetical protein
MPIALILAAFEPLDKKLPKDFATVFGRDDERVVVRLTWAEWRAIRAAIDALKEQHLNAPSPASASTGAGDH